MIPQRLKGSRALQLQARKHLRIVSSKPADDEREHRDTDRASSEMEAADRVTMEPEPVTETDNQRPAMTPPARPRMTAEDLRRHPGYNGDDFGCVSALAIVEGQEEVRRSSGAIAEFDRGLDRRFATQTAAIAKAIDANYALVRTEVVALRTEHETFRSELESLKAQLATFEPLKAKIAELEARITTREGMTDASGVTQAKTE